MKKLISIVMMSILLFSCIGLTAFASPSSATISDDYQKFYLDGNTYSRFNTSMVELDYFDTNITVELNTTQQETVDQVTLQVNADTTFIRANINFKDGAVLSAEFLRDDYLDTYNEMSFDENGLYTIDFEYPDGNTVATAKSNLFGSSVTLTADKLEMCSYYPVWIQNDDGTLTAYKGSLITIENEYYYVSYEDLKLQNWYHFDPYEYDELPAYEISNAELIADIQAAEESYYSDDFGFLFDDSLTKAVSTVFLVFVFAIIPFAIFVVCLILAIRSKAVYKKLFRFIYILSAAELVIFAIVTSFVMMGR